LEGTDRAHRDNTKDVTKTEEEKTDRSTRQEPKIYIGRQNTDDIDPSKDAESLDMSIKQPSIVQIDEAANVSPVFLGVPNFSREQQLSKNGSNKTSVLS